jgi:chaperonin GroES
MQVQPLFDRVLVKRSEELTKTRSGLYLPESAAEKPVQGVILAVGQGRVGDTGKVTPLTVKAGDKIVFNKYAGTEIKIDGEERLIMREEDILGIVEE